MAVLSNSALFEGKGGDFDTALVFRMGVWLTLYDSCKICLKRLEKGIPKVNCMLFLGHLDDMHGLI